MRMPIRILAGATLCLAFIGSFWIVSMLLDRDPPVKYDGARALASSVPQGGTLEVEFEVFRSRICASNTKRWLVDSMLEQHSIPQFTVGLRLLAGRETYRRTITIPQNAAVGPARYYVTLDYFCNVFHQMGFPIRVTSPSINFDITPAVSLVPFGPPPSME